MTLLVVYRMGRERLLPAEKNLVSRGDPERLRAGPALGPGHKATFLSLPAVPHAAGTDDLVWLGHAGHADRERDWRGWM